MTQANLLEDAPRLRKARMVWDSEAATFDDEIGHGLNDPQARHAWTELLRKWLPADVVTVLDAGCGTGSLSILLAGLGLTVTGIDVSPAMLDRARAKAGAQNCTIDCRLMDAAVPQFPPQSFDAVVCRHVLWTLPEPAHVLQQWARLLRPRGRLLLVEGWWSTGAGLHAADVVAALPASLALLAVEMLSDHPVYWGKPVGDERYLIAAALQP